MKKYLLLSLIILCTGLLSAQNVGVGTTNTTMQILETRLTDLEAKLNSLLTPSVVQNNK